VIGRSGQAARAGTAATAIRPSASATQRHDANVDRSLAIVPSSAAANFHRLKHAGSAPQSASNACAHARPAA
jgi:hypothetical protein